MGVVSGVGVKEEPLADGYLRGQIWNRQRKRADSYLCFKLIHSSVVAQNNGSINGIPIALGTIPGNYLVAVAFYYRDTPTGETYTFPAGTSLAARLAHFRRIDEPGYYSEESSNSIPSLPDLVLPGWERPPGQLAAWSPRIKYKDLIPYSDTSNLYYLGAALPDIWWQKEGGSIRVEGFDSLPSVLPIGGSDEGLSAEISDTFFDDYQRAVEVRLDLSKLVGHRYYVIAFSHEAEDADPSSNSFTMTNVIQSISASEITGTPQLDNFDVYPPGAKEMGEIIQTAETTTRHTHFSGTRIATTRVFLYNTRDSSGRWVLNTEPVSYNFPP